MITPTRIDLRLCSPLHQKPSSPKRTRGILFWIPFFSSSIGIGNHVRYIKKTLFYAGITFNFIGKERFLTIHLFLFIYFNLNLTTDSIKKIRKQDKIKRIVSSLNLGISIALGGDRLVEDRSVNYHVVIMDKCLR